MDTKDELLSIKSLGTFQQETNPNCMADVNNQAMEVDRKVINRKRKILRMKDQIEDAALGDPCVPVFGNIFSFPVARSCFG